MPLDIFGTTQAVQADIDSALDAHRAEAGAHASEAILDPSVTTYTPDAGHIYIETSLSSRRGYVDWGSGTAVGATVSGLVPGGELFVLTYETTGAGVGWDWSGEADVYARGSAPTASGVHRLALQRDPDGILEVSFFGEREAV